MPTPLTPETSAALFRAAGAALYGLFDEVLAVEDSAPERAEDASGSDLAMIEGKTGHFRIGIDGGDVAQFQADQSFFASVLGSRT